MQQRAACLGALQALAFCPEEGTRTAEGIAAGGCLPQLLALLKSGPLPLRSLAAGTLCNLTLGSPAIAVSPPPSHNAPKDIAPQTQYIRTQSCTVHACCRLLHTLIQLYAGWNQTA